MSLPVPSTSTAPPLDPRELQKFDAPLLALTQACGGDLRQLLYHFFSFLHRRTDLYIVPDDEDLADGKASMGFRQGDAEKIILAAFRQFPLRKIPPKAVLPVATVPKAKAVKKDTTAPKADKEPPVSTTTKEKAKPSSTPPAKDQATTTTTSTAPVDNLDGVRYTEQGKQIPVGNGGSTRRYKWTQTLDECTVMMGVPAGCRGKDLQVDLKPHALAVAVKKSDGPPKTLLEGPLVNQIVPDESTWTLESGVLVMILYKKAKTFWKTIIEGDEEIDASLVDSRRHIGDYDESTQAQIRKILFDQNQERRGLPTSDELAGAKPIIPPLPPGVEYIDSETLEKHEKDKKAKD